MDYQENTTGSLAKNIKRDCGLYKRLWLPKKYFSYKTKKTKKTTSCYCGAQTLDNADGVSWMPSYSTNPNELLFDSECRVDKTIGYIDKYKRGIGVTLKDVPVFDVCITYNSIVQDVQSTTIPR